MPEPEDQQLLADFANSNSEAAFAALAERYVNLVYSTALRFAGNPPAAEEISQAVFIVFARKAAGLRRGTVLSGWFYQTARLTSADYVKREIRRQRREQEAYMQSTLIEPAPDTWSEMAPLLDEAMGRLGETDRNAVVLRYFENRTAREVAVALKMTEAAAHKRVNRAVEKLRRFFAKRGVLSTTAIIAGAVSNNSVHAAPVGLANTLSTVALAKGAAASTSTLTLVKGTLKIMAWTKAKTAIAIGMGALLIAGTACVAVKTVKTQRPEDWQKQFDLSFVNRLPPQVKILPSLHSASHLRGESNGKALSLGADVPDILMEAYGVGAAQIIWNTPIPDGKYDFIANLATGADNSKALQEGIQKKFDLTGRYETVETNVLVLTVESPTASGLRPSAGRESGVFTGNSYSAHNQALWVLDYYIERYLGAVVIDQTGLMGNYDIDFTWDGTLEGLQRVLLDQLGLSLVSTNMPNEMLVVEKAE